MGKFNGYECFHCGAKAVIWQADFDFEDYGYDGQGIIHSCRCQNCGAEIEYTVRFDAENTNVDDQASYS